MADAANSRHMKTMYSVTQHAKQNLNAVLHCGQTVQKLLAGSAVLKLCKHPQGKLVMTGTRFRYAFFMQGL